MQVECSTLWFFLVSVELALSCKLYLYLKYS